MGKERVESSVEGAPRVAASSYLNTAPLIWSFLRGEQRRVVQLLTDTAPSRCAQMLKGGEAEAALVPVIEYQRMEDALIVPGVCVGSRGRVRSVVLVTRGMELEQVRRVALSSESRTSVALVQIIFREFLQLEPEMKVYAPDLSLMLREADAALMIGDPAMTFPREGLRVYDLASLWRERTGFGFVFAMWMAREGGAQGLGKVDFAAARDEGLAHVWEIAERYEGELGLPQRELREYLSENIVFTLDEEMRAGLDLFYRLAHRHGLIPTLRPLKMFDR